MTAEEIIARLGLRPLAVEGGYFRETWRSPDMISVPRFPAARASGSSIYYLLTPDTFSALHRLPTDEVYHFYLGDPVRLVLLEQGGPAREVVLGPDLAAGQHLQYVVRRGVWQGSRLVEGGQFALLGTTMAPAFEFSDYEAGTREQLLREFPSAAEQIRTLTRD